MARSPFNPESSSPKIFAVGDIHGSAEQLSVLLSQKDLYSNRCLLFLGDYVDVGPDSATVIATLSDLQTHHPSARFLCGNHDIELLRFYHKGDFVRYAQHGGLATIRSYVSTARGDIQKQFREAVPISHITFLERLGIYYETDDFLFSHSGISPTRVDDRSVNELVMTSHQDLFLNEVRLPKTVICGHYFQRTLKPYLAANVICLDSGCGILDGPLSAMLLPERTLVQVDRGLRLSYSPG